MRAEWQAHLVFFAIGVPLLVLWIVVAFRAPESGWEKAVAIIAGTEAFGHFWLLRYRIETDGETITYRTLFKGSRSARFDRPRSVSIRFRGPIEPPFDQPNYCLRLQDDGRFSRRPLLINMKPFRIGDLARLAELIVANAPAAEVEESVKRLARGELRPGSAFRWKSAVQLAAFILTVGLIAALVRLVVSSLLR